MPIDIPLPISKGGTGQAAIGEDAFAAGADSSAANPSSLALGFRSWAYGERSSAIGYNCYGGGYGTTSVGHMVNSPIGETSEFGYWINESTRGGSIRTDSTGVSAFTVIESATSLVDGGANDGLEPKGTLPRNCAAFRQNGGQLFIDYNNNGSVGVKGFSSVVCGQFSAISQSTIDFPPPVVPPGDPIPVGVYRLFSLSYVPTFDSSNSIGMSYITRPFPLIITPAIVNTSGASRLFNVTASIEVEKTTSGTHDIGIKLGKMQNVISISNILQLNETEIQENTSQNNPAYMTTSWIVRLDNNDAVCIFIANLSANASIQFNRGRLVAASID